MRRLFFSLCFLASTVCAAQTVDSLIILKQREVNTAESIRVKKVSELHELKLERYRSLMLQTGLPHVESKEQLLQHPAMFIGYSTEHKQARWVAHIISPDISTGVVLRTNDFRTDSTVKGAWVTDKDYFLSSTKADGTIVYDGFGFDRGHLAPSADFRWNQEALSQSYMYSNISPQPADFNRGIWGDLEEALRSYVMRNPASEVMVLTGPVLSPNLKKIERGVNKVSIPEKFWKVAYDLKLKRAIGFLLPVNAVPPLNSYAVPVDEVEKITGLDLFNKLSQADQSFLENSFDVSQWLSEKDLAEVPAIAQPKLPPGYFNTLLARDWMNRGETVTICGTVVGARKSRAGNILINLDKPFPDQVFTIFIRDEDIPNLPWDPLTTLKGKKVCIKGRVVNIGGTAAMYLERETQLSFL